MPLPVNPLTVAAVVKEATETLHSEVENLLLPELAAITSPHHYAQILRLFYGYFQPLEKRLALTVTTHHLPDIAERRKSSAILHDLAAIGQSTDALPVCGQLPVFNNTAEAFGVMYVLEGSTLGGKMIARMLQKNEALQLPPGAVRFFSGYGEKTGEKWKIFLSALNEQEPADAVIAAANETFYYLKRWMQHFLSHD
jgi:heme oxygenase